MAKICQRSPCDRFLEALGKYILGRPQGKPDHYVQTAYVEDAEETNYEVYEVRIDYCPFCGTRLDDLDEEYLITKRVRVRSRPKKRLAS